MLYEVITLPDGTVTAESEMTLANVPQEFMDGVDSGALGWHVGGTWVNTTGGGCSAPSVGSASPIWQRNNFV